MSKRRLEQRRMAEAAEKIEKVAGSETKRAGRKTKTTTKKAPTRRTKEKAVQRKRLVWCVFNGSMKEEARFPYDQREAAEERLEQLKAKGTKKLYFLQPVKEVITDSPIPATRTAVPFDDDEEEVAEAVGGEEE